MPPSKDDIEKQREKQFERQVHQGNLQVGDGGATGPEVLEYVSKLDGVDTPVESVDWMNNPSASTTKLSEEDTKSREWEIEFYLTMAPQGHPPKEGVTGALRAYVYDEPGESKTPLSQEELMELLGYGTTGKDSAKRSEGGWATETSTRDTNESIIRDDNGDGGRSGLLGRFTDG